MEKGPGSGGGKGSVVGVVGVEGVFVRECVYSYSYLSMAFTHQSLLLLFLLL